jgi:hypothetical protein
MMLVLLKETPDQILYLAPLLLTAVVAVAEEVALTGRVATAALAVVVALILALEEPQLLDKEITAGRHQEVLETMDALVEVALVR